MMSPSCLKTARDKNLFQIARRGGFCISGSHKRVFEILPFHSKKDALTLCVCDVSLFPSYSEVCGFQLSVVFVKCVKIYEKRCCFSLMMMVSLYEGNQKAIFVLLLRPVSEFYCNKMLFCTLYLKICFLFILSLRPSFILSFPLPRSYYSLYPTTHFLLLTVIKPFPRLPIERQKSHRHAHTGHVMNSSFL